MHLFGIVWASELAFKLDRPEAHQWKHTIDKICDGFKWGFHICSLIFGLTELPFAEGYASAHVFWTKPKCLFMHIPFQSPVSHRTELRMGVCMSLIKGIQILHSQVYLPNGAAKRAGTLPQDVPAHFVG